MPLVTAPRTQAAAGAHLNYYGGHVLSNINVVVVFWGSNVDSNTQSQIGGFYSAVTASPYVDWLNEYATNVQAMDGTPGTNQQIGRGSLGGTVTISPSVTGATIDDSQIQSELEAQITSGKLPAPDANTLYTTYFPPGVTITQGGGSSCSVFCAYHNTFTHGGQSTFYSVMPDFGPTSGCAQGCGSGAPFDNLTSASSHEMVEAITDAEVGLASGYAKPMAWMDQANGEIGDICNGQDGPVAGYTVQTEWSNSMGACIVTNPSVTPPPPTPTPTATPNPTGTPGSAGDGGGGKHQLIPGLGCDLGDVGSVSWLGLSLIALGATAGFTRRRRTTP